MIKKAAGLLLLAGAYYLTTRQQEQPSYIVRTAYQGEGGLPPLTDPDPVAEAIAYESPEPYYYEEESFSIYDLFPTYEEPTYMTTADNVSAAAAGWTPPPSAEPWLDTIRAAEDMNMIPRNLLARLLYQESRFRHDIITGQVRSSAGAVGIAQIVPRWHPDVDPLDPIASINYAAQYLRRLYRQFGSWDKALAAYNWGPGNVSRYGLASLPAETHNYITEILGDLGMMS